jgi:predicted molibdopterin-dependent oxidoreductase YjgC
MGICFECRVTVDGKVVRACQTGCREGMEVWVDAG